MTLRKHRKSRKRKSSRRSRRRKSRRRKTRRKHRGGGGMPDGYYSGKRKRRDEKAAKENLQRVTAERIDLADCRDRVKRNDYKKSWGRVDKEEKERCLALVKKNDPVYIAALEKQNKEDEERADREEAAKKAEYYKQIENLPPPEGGKEGLAFYKVNGSMRHEEDLPCDPARHRCRSNKPELYARHDKDPYVKQPM